jgi:hypothetical protein
MMRKLTLKAKEPFPSTASIWAVGESGSAAVEPVWAWDLSFVVARLQQRLGWHPAYCCAIEVEYRKFMSLAVLEPSASLGMAGPVDEFWHEHILCTRDYHLFCERVAGEYIHHSPAFEGGTADQANYRRTIALLGKHFGLNLEVWPDPARMGMGCNNCAACDKLETESSLLSTH